jgi:D-xylose 1-dehydrogenase (NADP+, D-xylono-1,5-lactone-forming)
MPNQTAKVHWGILGVANIRKRLLPAFAKTQHAQLRAIASRSLERAKTAAAEANIPVAYGSYEQLLDDPEIEAVYIPLPNTLHDEWTRKAAERGKHILCEKPLTPTAAEARELVAFCKAKGVRLMDGFMWPHHPRTHRLRQFLDEGGIGTIQRVSGSFTFKLEPFATSNIRLQPELAGGSLLDVGCYPVYGIRWAFGAEPVRVFATARYQNDVDVEMNGMLYFADGRMATFDCGFTLPLRGWLEITGSDGVVRIPDMWVPTDPATFEANRDGHPTEVVSIAGEDQIVHMIDDFNDAILHGTPVYPAPDEAVKTLRVLDALAASARSGKVVEV